MSGKGDKRIPGEGYASGWDRIYGEKKMALPQTVICEHCGYDNEYETNRLSAVGAEGAWCCPSCSICNTTYRKPQGYATVLGYQRDLEVGYL